MKSITNIDNLQEYIELISGIVKGEPEAIEKFFVLAIKFPFAVRDMIYFSRLEKFIRGVYRTSEDSIRLSDKLFNDEKHRNSNAIRVLEIIGQIDAEEKLDFIIAATRCLLCGNIDKVLYFRIITAINNTLLEDLGYLSEHVLDGVIKVGNQYTLGLEKSGLMINDSIDGNIDSEYQSATFTTLGMQVVEYAIDVDDTNKAKKINEYIEKKKIAKFGQLIHSD